MAKFIVTLVVETDAACSPPTKRGLKNLLLRALGMDWDTNARPAVLRADELVDNISVRSVDLD